MNATGNATAEEVEDVMSSLDAFRHESIKGRLYGGVDECLNVSWAALVVLELACPLRYSRAMLKINVSHYLKTYLHLRLAVVCGRPIATAWTTLGAPASRRSRRCIS